MSEIITDPGLASEKSYRDLAEKLIGGQITIEEFTQDMQAWEERLKSLADHDPLITDFYNTRAMIRELDKAIYDSRRTGQGGVLLAVDVDHLKAMNDALGHVKVDDILINMCSCFQESSRKTDFWGRVGGDEFLGFLRDTDSIQAAVVAERILNQVKTKLGQTVSIGITDLKNGDTVASLRQRADQALYQAKETKNSFSIL